MAYHQRVTETNARTLPRGVMVALATPTDAHGELDDAGLQKLIDHVLAGGVSGVCPVGSTGEGPRFTVEQRLVITARVRSLVPASVAVVPALGVTSVACAHSELMRLAELMVTAALVAPPSYYPLAPDEMFDLYAGLADSSVVPLVLYNIPSFTKVSIPRCGEQTGLPPSHCGNQRQQSRHGVPQRGSRFSWPPTARRISVSTQARTRCSRQA